MKDNGLDCVCAFDNGKRSCTALTQKKCNGCNFRKTPEEVRAGRERAARRLRTLPEEQQKQIRDSYHNKTSQKY